MAEGSLVRLVQVSNAHEDESAAYSLEEVIGRIGAQSGTPLRFERALPWADDDEIEGPSPDLVAFLVVASPAYLDSNRRHEAGAAAGSGVRVLVAVVADCQWRGEPWASLAIPLLGGRVLANEGDLELAARDFLTRMDRGLQARASTRTAKTKRAERSAERATLYTGPVQTAEPREVPSILAEFEASKRETVATADSTLTDGRSANHIAGFANDEPRAPRDEDDVLETRADVHALASLIAARSVSPPLSVGLFGDWGSGKTHFMNRLARRVDTLSAGPHARPDGVYHKGIVQIRFNAWNYADGNLWASLVHHIFENLRLPAEDPGKARAELLARIEGKEREVSGAEAAVAAREAEANAAGAAAAASERERTRESGRIRAALASALAEAPEKTREILKKEGESAAHRLSIPSSALDSAAELEEQLRKARSLSRRVAALVESGPERIAVAVGAFVVAAIAGVVAWLLAQPAAVSALATLGGAVTAVAGGLAWGLARANAWISRLEDVKERIDRADRERRQAAAADAKRALEALEAATARVEREKERAAKLRGELDALREALSATSPARRFESFVAGRAASDDYRRRLGLLATVRRDFEALSDLMVAGRHVAGDRVEVQPVDQRVKRIVLYIDDLDRCPPARVVEVLEAVHLLLAFELFVVVVAVDSRWVTRALVNRYGEMLADEDGKWDAKASPLDYLEKIFQIPIWVRPIGREGSRRLVASLVKPGDVVTTLLPQERAPQTAAASDDGGAPAGSRGSNDPPAPTGASVDPGIVDERNTEESARLLELTPREREFLEKLAPAAARSPRALKRFVNCYRLIRVRHREGELERFLDDARGPPEFERVAVALALVVGAPGASRVLMRSLESARSHSFRIVLDEFLRVRITTLSEKEGDRIKALLKIDEARRVLELPASEAVEAAHLAWRYSFAYEPTAVSA